MRRHARWRCFGWLGLLSALERARLSAYRAVVVLYGLLPPPQWDRLRGRCVSLLHKGPYENLSVTYRLIFGAWLPASGRELRDVPCFEHYLNSPQSARPEDLLTVIHVPVG